jgi:hypothetical protein
VAGADPIENAPKIVALFGYLESLRQTLVVPLEDNFFDEFDRKANAYHEKYNPPTLAAALAQRSKTSVDMHEPDAAVHEPRHDVESMFWLLCFALARANPKSDAPNPHDPTEAYSEFCEVMLNRPRTSSLRDDRGRYLEETEEGWKAILHPKLARLSGLLHHMGQYLAIRSFDHQNTQWGSYHAHQVFKILLVSAIKTFQSGDPILLCQHAPRYAQPVTRIPTYVLLGNKCHSPAESTATTTSLWESPPSGDNSRGSLKRGRSEAGLDADEQISRKRAKVDHPARLEQEEQPIANAEVMEHLRMLRNHKLWYYTGSRDHCVHCC